MAQDVCKRHKAPFVVLVALCENISDRFLDQKIHRTWCLHESLNFGSQCAWKISDPIPIPSAAPTNMSDDQ